MAKSFFVFLTLLVISIVQVSFATAFFPEKSVPSLPLIFAVFWTIFFGFNEKWLRIVALGLVFDIFSFSTLGISVFSLTLTAFGISFLAKRFLVASGTWKFFWALAFVFLGTYVSYAFVYLIEILKSFFPGFTVGNFSISLSNLALQSVFNLLLGAIFYFPVIKWENFLRRISTQDSLVRNSNY